jgi:hypothetical protein
VLYASYVACVVCVVCVVGASVRDLLLCALATAAPASVRRIEVYPMRAWRTLYIYIHTYIYT